MPLPRFKRLNPERRETILEAATAEFAAHGFRGASYNGIIAEAGVSKGAMYYYFDDKVDLFLTVVSEVFKGFPAALGEMPDVTTQDAFWRELYGLFERVWRWVASDERAMAIGRALASAIDSGEIGVEATGFMADVERVTVEIVQKGQAVGAVRTDLPTEFLVRLFLVVGQALDGWIASHMEAMSTEEMERFMVQGVDLFKRLGGPGEV